MTEFKALKRRALEKYFEKMNDRQREAVFCINGPLLILAGAGSGKTTVLVNRIANMIFFGSAYDSGEPNGVTESDLDFLRRFAEGKESDCEKLRGIVAYDCVNPWNILAITFTNKAAGELKERIANMLGEAGSGITAATFHSACVRILRRECEALGYGKSFTIYDTDDQKRILKGCLAELEKSEKMFPVKMLLKEISGLKDKMIYPEQYSQMCENDYRQKIVAQIYSKYQSKLLEANAMDFDDLICKTVELFESFPDVLRHYQNLYKYVVVDEYQDTNPVQYKLVSMLTAVSRNLCVVGDDDQSIYKFRGATIENILQFENRFENCKVIRLEQNYRSTQNILSCANQLIKNNSERKGKNLWTAAGDGEKVCVYKAASAVGESRFVAETILQNVKNGASYKDHAVLYRTNAQSNALEQAMIASAVPYKILGGVKFYDRKEIRDILAYLQVINNEADVLRFRRIANVPKRQIGDATIATVEQICSDLGCSPLQVLRESADLAPLARKSSQLTALAAVFDHLQGCSEQLPLDELLNEVMSSTGYRDMLLAQGEEGLTRLANIEELKSTMVNYTEAAEEPSLGGFLEEVSLYTDIDSLDSNADYVAMMTIHAAKGLEFPTVFVVGMEEGIFPLSMNEDNGDLQEERRLAYVAITRAKRKLYLSYARERLLYGNISHNPPSLFIGELPDENIEKKQDIALGSLEPKHIPIGKNKNPSANFGNMFGGAKRASPSIRKNETFRVGDRVSHKIFGEGTVLDVVPTASDTRLEIAFDKVGTKKIMAAFAKITKL